MSARGLAGLAVLGAWGAGLAVFTGRELGRSPRERLAEAAVRVSPGALYFAVERSGVHVGFASTTIDTVPDGLQITSYRVVDEARGSRSARASEHVVVATSRGLILRRVQSTVTRDGATRRLDVAVHGDSEFTLTRQGVDGPASTVSHRFTAPLLVAAMVPLAIALGERPEPGDQRTFTVLDPARSDARLTTYRILAESTLVVTDSATLDGARWRWVGARADSMTAWHVRSDDGALDAWIDERGGEVLRTGEGTQERRAAYELAFENWRANAGPDRDAARGAGADEVPSAFDIRDRSPARDSLVVTVAGLDLRNFAAASGLQVIDGARLRVTRARITNASPEFWLPVPRSHHARHAEFLRVEPLVDVEDPAIVALAGRLRQRLNDPRVVARVIAEWVADSVARRTDVVVPSASATLRSRGGDENAHANLFVALARAAHVPSRVVSGVLFEHGVPHYHAWAEVYTGQWIPVDPTFGEFPADARHVRLALAGAGIRAEIMRLVARARWQVSPPDVP